MQNRTIRAAITLLAAAGLSAAAWLALRSVGPAPLSSAIEDGTPGRRVPQPGGAAPDNITSEGPSGSGPAVPQAQIDRIPTPAGAAIHPAQDKMTAVTLAMPAGLRRIGPATLILVAEFEPGFVRMLMTRDFESMPGSVMIDPEELRGAKRLSVLVKNASGVRLAGVATADSGGFGENAEIPLSQSGKVIGSVSAGALAAHGARVFMHKPPGTPDLGPWVIEAACDESGAFVIENVADGPWTVFATHPDLGNSTLQTIVALAGSTGVSLALRKESGLFGNLYESSGGAAREMTLWFESAASGSRFRAVTSADGGFRVMCPDDEYTIWPECPKRESVSWKARSGEQLIDLRLPARSPLRVTVTDKQTGQPVNVFGMTLNLEDGRGILTRLSGHDPRPMGCNTRLLMLLPGRYTIVVTAGGRIPASSGLIEIKESSLGEARFDAALENMPG